MLKHGQTVMLMQHYHTKQKIKNNLFSSKLNMRLPIKRFNQKYLGNL